MNDAQETTEEASGGAARALRRNRLVRAVGTISFFTLLSRILGFVRDIVIARGFGAGMGADAFFVALKLPNFLRRLFAEGAFSAAFVPVFSDYLARGDENETRRVAQAVFTTLLLVLAGVVLIGQVAMPLLITVAAPGFYDDPEKFELTVLLTRITFPYILFISLCALAGGILNSHHKYAVPAATPLLLNASLIGCATLLAPRLEQPAVGLAIGVFLGGVLQLALQWPALKRIGLPFRLRFDFKHPAIKRTLLLMGPAILGVSVAQINLLFDVLLASLLPDGSISYLYYADRLVEFPLGLIGIAMGTAILPALSAHAAQNDIDGLRQDLSFALRLIVVINIPAAVGLIVLREPILALLFERGAFTPETTALTAQALLAYATGLVAFSAVKVAAPAFYARKNTKTPVRIAMYCMLANMVFNVILMFPFAHAGLALATALASYLNIALLLRALKKDIGFSLNAEIWRAAWRAGLASIGMAAALAWGVERFWRAGELSGAERAIVLLPLIIGGILVFALLAKILRLQEIEQLWGLLRRKRSRGAS
ncbi:murein biosynthesis integral membrane protein MurJ [Magnetofaba australis]|uniref:Probable lipid II flippase MurJ n=1 Tax=Magnetofaba australis IT-1 TaxID=1434232 RepID=A0A1Y2K7S8_9PROT|nr:murein biosynthesis integral membrane protein MurJ [Magnetofaba australis]OSM06790.1 putative integral membrane protein MviN [Magnetofaba australis IT-1]